MTARRSSGGHRAGASVPGEMGRITCMDGRQQLIMSLSPVRAEEEENGHCLLDESPWELLKTIRGFLVGDPRIRSLGEVPSSHATL